MRPSEVAVYIASSCLFDSIAIPSSDLTGGLCEERTEDTGNVP